MITVPSIASLATARVYADSASAEIAYADVLHPAAAQGDRPARWFPMPGEMAYLAGEVRFGPGPEGFGEVAAAFPNRRLMPMPWDISTVHAWYRDGDESRVLAEGKTSGFGASNAIFNGSAPARALIAPLRVGAALSCPALVMARVEGEGKAGLGDLNERRSGGGWDRTVGEVLVEQLSESLTRGTLTLSIDAPGLTADAVDELQTQALLEWAYQLQPAGTTIAYPLSALSTARWPPATDLRLDWNPGDRITLRAIRVLNCEKLE